MSQSITEDLETLLVSQVRAGNFTDPNEAAAEALKILTERAKKFKELKQSIDKAFDNDGVYYTDEEVSQHLKSLD